MLHVPLVNIVNCHADYLRQALATLKTLCYIARNSAAFGFPEGFLAAELLALNFPGRGGMARDIGRVDVSEPASISTGIAARYASAVFDLSKEGKKLKALETDIATLEGAMADSDDFRTLLTSPLYSREEQGTAIAAIAKKMKLSPTVANVLGLLASKRRLFVLPQLVATLREMMAEERGEVTAEVTSAKALTKAQSDKLAKTLKEQVGKAVSIQETVDESIIGGLIVKVGSKMIDTSIKSKLNALQNTMKEVG